jgi:hypothetical protein
MHHASRSLLFMVLTITGMTMPTYMKTDGTNLANHLFSLQILSTGILLKRNAFATMKIFAKRKRNKEVENVDIGSIEKQQGHDV